MSPTLRPATLADARTLAALAERTFRDTFAAHNSPQNTDAHCRAHYGEAQQAAEIRRFYVVAPWLGKGIANALMQACLEALRSHGSAAALFEAFVDADQNKAP
jgi:GNAT superfamily N-acetyltransferase